MERDKLKTKVVLRQWRESRAKREGDVIALFPEIPGNMNPKSCSSYEHVGQHGAADYGCVIAYTRPIGQYTAKAKDLLNELRGLGYNLDIVSKCTADMDTVRIDELYKDRKATT